MKSFLRKIFSADIKVRHGFLFGAFFIPVFLLGITLVSWQIHPLGDMSPLTCDLFYQYAPFLAELRNKIWSAESLFFSWNIGSGMNFWSVIGYYLGSPLNLILVILPKAFLLDGITLLILLRTGLAGLFFAIFLRARDGKEDVFTMILSIAYALSGYMVAYYWNIMWLDAVVLLPLVVLGLWRLIEGKKPTLFVVSLAAVIFANFYTGFFVCVFLLLFGPLLYLEARRGPKILPGIGKILLRFSAASLMAAAIAAIMLVPVLASLKNTLAVSDTISFPSDAVMQFSLFDFGTRMFFNAEPMIREKLPNIFSGVAVLILVPLYGLCSKIRFSERIIGISLAMFLYLSMSSRILDFLWNGMHFTNQVPFRQSFLFCFVMLYLASRVLVHPGLISRKKIFGVTLGVLIYLLVYNHAGEIQRDWKTVYGTAALVVLYGTSLIAAFSDEEKKRKFGRRVFLYALIFEMFFVVQLSFAYIDKTEHLTMYSSFGQYSSEIQTAVLESDGPEFYRTVVFPEYTGNDGAMYGLKSPGVFSSVNSYSYTQFMSNIGIGSDNPNDIRAAGFTDVTAGLFGIRNIVTLVNPEKEEEVKTEWPGLYNITSAIIEEEESQDSDVLFSGVEMEVRDRVLPIGYMVSSDGITNSVGVSPSPFDNTNELLISMGEDPVYSDGVVMMVSSSDISQNLEDEMYSIDRTGYASMTLEPDVFRAKSTVLLYIGTSQKMTVQVSMQDYSTNQVTTNKFVSEGNAVIDCGNSAQYGEETLTVQIIFESSEPERFPIYCATIDEQKLDQVFSSLNSGSLEIQNYGAAFLAGTVETEESGILFLSVPYDEGWKAEIDGKQANTVQAYGAMLGIPVEPGSHEVLLRYTPPGFVSGAVLTVVGIGAAIFLLAVNPYGIMGDGCTRYPRKKRTEAQIDTGERGDT